MPAQHVVRLPDAISFETGAAMMLKGLTAQYLLQAHAGRRRTCVAGDFILFHAAAGGVGLIACQWARALGLKLIGTAGSDEKCALARDNGAAFTHQLPHRGLRRAGQGDHRRQGREGGLRLGRQGHLRQVARLPAAVRPDGRASAPPRARRRRSPSALLGAKGRCYLTRPTLFTHIATREATQAMADDLFAVVESGQVKIRIDQRYALADAAQAHRDLEARKTTGSSILVPEGMPSPERRA